MMPLVAFFFTDQIALIDLKKFAILFHRSDQSDQNVPLSFSPITSL